MTEDDINDEQTFYLTVMPASRPVHYCLAYADGSVYIDFDNYEDARIILKRISFDGYGCCHLGDEAIPMNDIDSLAFREIIKAQLSDQTRLTTIVKKAIWSNRTLIWEDALHEYGLL